ncbi:MAG: DUF4907 domain-containing protein [Bacteroidetes bacterium]|nr:MAG: DUF4907 domain-containing protein [Bacteroidota bacterium]
MKNNGLILFYVCCMLFFGVSCLSPHDPSAYSEEDIRIHDSENTEEFVKKEEHDDSSHDEILASALPKYEARVFQVESPALGFGYRIFVDGVQRLNQNTIPSISGNKAFSSPEKAMKAAEFVIHKMQQGSFPPSVNEAELDSLGVLQ